MKRSIHTLLAATGALGLFGSVFAPVLAADMPASVSIFACAGITLASWV